MATIEAKEVEAKLLVSPAKAKDIFKELSRLDTFDRYHLDDAVHHTIKDIYFDATDQRLHHADMALRLRYENDECRITLKGKAVRVGDVTSRLEVEERCSLAAVKKMVKLLNEQGIKFDEGDLTPEQTPQQAMTALGLGPIQQRSCHRIARNICDGSGAWAELALDCVRYPVANDEVLHYEIEVEALKPEMMEALVSFTRSMRQRYGAALSTWQYSKVATAVALEALAADTGLTAITCKDGISVQGYQALAHYLEAHHFP
ncbi:MAG: hypothetical protein BMS9Abin36_1980 [Gammaproteobacteria bacterium]|nr:MAG: hypothetical protein BMS9Abin36_1980 [Gammaproteobacteria bacterium]